MSAFWTAVKNVLLIVIVCLISFEVLSAVAGRTGLIAMNLPSYRWPTFKPFWADINEHFGVWHAPFSRYTHVTACYNLEYRANRFGMRDKGRNLQTERPRLVVLGDSFAEGFGLAREDRVSDRLELMTGAGHLNFGTSGDFGPTQYWLAYKHLAKKFSHRGVVVFITADNDFRDDDPALSRKRYEGRYRPLLEENPDGGYRLVYQGKEHFGASQKGTRYEVIAGLRNIVRNFTHSANAVDFFKQAIAAGEASDGTDARRARRYSGYFDFTQAQAKRMRYVMNRIFEEAGGRPVFVVLIARPRDLARLESEGSRPEATPLRRLFASIADNRGGNVMVLDLMDMLATHEKPRQLFNACDGHWSAAGAKAVDEAMRAHPAYARGMLLAPPTRKAD